MNIHTYPCYRCESRKVLCHATCQAYIEYAAAEKAGKARDRMSKPSPMLANQGFGYYSEAEKRVHKGINYR